MPSSATSLFDRLAIASSALCLVHCLALPLIVAALPSLTLALAVPESIHIFALALAIPVSGIGLVQGYRRHGRRLPLGVALLGILLLTLGVTLPDRVSVETGLTVTGGLLLAYAHLRNLRAANRSRPDKRLAGQGRGG